MWTLQEFAGAKSLIYCGKSKPISAPCLIETLSQLTETHPSTIGAYFSTILHYTCFLMSHQEVNHSLEELFISLVHMLASDPRDKVYALRGLFPQTFLGLEVNYLKTPEQVFFDATRAIITNDRSLNILRWVTRHPGSRLSPSWIVDWEDKTLHREREHNASRVSKPLYSFSTSGSKLTLWGVEIATITENISPRLSALNIHKAEWQGHNGLLLSPLEVERMFLGAICGLYKGLAKTVYLNFEAFFRTALSFLFPQNKASSTYIDYLLTINLQQGEMPPLNKYEHLYSTESNNRVIFMTMDGKFGFADEGIQPGR
jgi:hypothetical protein